MAGATAGAAMGIGKIIESAAATIMVQEVAKAMNLLVGANQLARMLTDKL